MLSLKQLQRQLAKYAARFLTHARIGPYILVEGEYEIDLEP